MALNPEMRASDDDREQVVARLKEAHAEGRLGDEEFMGRIDTVYQAQTYGELARLLRDLPSTKPAAKQVATPVAPRPTSGRTGGDKAMVVLWTIFLCTNAINLIVWTSVSLGSGELHYFWPIWSIGPWGAMLLCVEMIRRTVRARF